MITIIVLIIVVAIFFSIISSKSLSSYFPTKTDDVQKVVDALEIDKQEVVIDLGAGTGTVIFAAATEAYKKGLNTKFVAMDLHFIFVAIMFIRRLFHPNKENIEIKWCNIFHCTTESLVIPHKTAFYIYISPTITPEIATMLKDMDTAFKIVSYQYALDELQESHKIKGNHDIYVYHLT